MGFLPDGTLVVFGESSGPVEVGSMVLPFNAGTDVFVAAFDPDGGVRWAHAWGLGSTDDATDMVVTDEVHLLTQHTGPVDFGNGPTTAFGSDDYGVVRLDADGNTRWATILGTMGDDDFGGALDHDGAGGTIAAINFEGTATYGSAPIDAVGSDDALFATVDSGGGVGALLPFGSSGLDRAQAVASLGGGGFVGGGYAQGSLTFGAFTTTPLGGQDCFVFYRDSGGSITWAEGFGGAGDDTVRFIELAPDGSVWIAGAFMETADVGGGVMRTSRGDEDVFLQRRSAADGAPLATVHIGGPLRDEAGQVAVDGAGNAYLIGTFRDTVDFGEGPVAAQGESDVYLASYTPMGTLRWMIPITSTGTGDGETLAFDGAGDLWVAGDFGGEVRMGDLVHVADGPQDGIAFRVQGVGP
jgi:hypothetical protein